MSDEAKIKAQFEFFDRSNNGTIEEDELSLIFQALDKEVWTDEMIQKLLHDMDTNHDGRIQYGEFIDYIFKTAGEEKVLLSEEQMDQAREGLAKKGIWDRKATEMLLEQAQKAHWYKKPMKEKALQLLYAKANPNAVDRNGVTLMQHMAGKIDPPFAKVMLDAGVDLTRHGPEFSNPIFVAASFSNTELLRLLLMPDDTPVEVDESLEVPVVPRRSLTSVSGSSIPLTSVASVTSISSVDDSSPDKEGSRSFSLQLVGGMDKHTSPEIRELIQKKADVNFKDSSGWTPLTRATWLNRKEAVDCLIRSSTLLAGTRLRINKRNKQGRTALHIAARKELVDVMDLLLKNGAHLDVADPDGWTPLHHACFNGNDACVRMLVDRGANTDMKGLLGFTPFQVTRMREKPASLSESVLALVKPSEDVDFGKCILPVIKDPEKSTHDKIEELLSLPGVNQNPQRLRLHDSFFDPVLGPNKVRLKKIWELLIQPLLHDLRTGEAAMPEKPESRLSEEAKEEHRLELARRRKQQKAFAEMWMNATKGPAPTVHWTHDNRGSYKTEMENFMNLELGRFRAELDAVFENLREAESGEELIAFPSEKVYDESLLSQLGAHPRPTWLENLDTAAAFDQLRLVGVVKGGKEDDAATLHFAHFVTYEALFLSGAPFWRNIYRKWLAAYAQMADYDFHRRMQALMEKFNTSHESDGFKATYGKGPVKTYERMKQDELDRGLQGDASTFEGRSVAASCLDVVRGTIYVDTPKEALELLSFFEGLDPSEDKFKIVRVKNYYNEEGPDGMHGLRYIEMNVLFRGGVRLGICEREGKDIDLALVCEVVILLNDYVSIKQRRSLQYKLWRGFFDWLPVDENKVDDEEEGLQLGGLGVSSTGSRLRKKGYAGLLEDDVQ